MTTAAMHIARTGLDAQEAEWLRATVALHRALALAREERYPRAGLAFRDACGRFRTLAATATTRPTGAAPRAP